MLHTAFAGLAGLLAIGIAWLPSDAAAQSAERVFSLRAPSIVVVHGGGDRQGSGVVIAPRLVATNCHVIQGASRVSVRQERISHASRRAWQESERDICLLDVPTLDASPAPIGRASTLRVGAQVFAIGAPAGLELSLSAGIVSQLRGGESVSLVQTTAPISPGSSGGGLFDAQARLVGITTMYVGEGQNLNFAVPAERLTSAVGALAAWKRCRAAPSPECLLDTAIAMGWANGGEAAVAGAHIAVAMAHLAAGNPSAAEPLLAAALDSARVAPGAVRARAIYNVALAYRQIGDTGRAAELLQEALAVHSQRLPERPDADGWVALSTGTFLAHDVAIALIELGAFGTAFAVVEQLDSAERVRALLRLSDGQVSSGDREGAGRTRAQALRYARHLDDFSSRAHALLAVSAAQRDAGDRPAAIRTLTEASASAVQVDSDFVSNGLLMEIREAQVLAGDANGAIARARRIESREERVQALTSIATAQSRAGDARGAARSLAEALSLARTVEPEARDWSLLSVVRTQARVGTMTDAISLAREIGRAEVQARAFVSIAVAQIDSDDESGAARSLVMATTLAASLQDQRRRSDVFYSVTSAQLRAGDTRGALVSAEEITERSTWGMALIKIAEEQERRGDWVGSAILRRRIFDEVHRSAGNLRDVAVAEARAGNIRTAFEVLDDIDDVSDRAAALGTIAASLINRH